MQENIILDEVSEGYQILVTGIKWNKETTGKYRSKKDFYSKLPEQTTFILPENIVAKESTPDFYDMVESWIYNILMKRYNHIANRCQIWLPLRNTTN